MRRFLAVLAIGILAGCGGRPAPPAILVGHVSVPAGGNEAGEQAIRGIRLAVSEFNPDASGPLVVLHTDTRGQLDFYEPEAVRLATVNGVSALLGGRSPEEVERLDRAHLPVIGLSGARTQSMSDRVFQAGLPPAARGTALADVYRPVLASRFVAGISALGGPHPLAALSSAVADPRGAAAVLVDRRRQDHVEAAEAFQAALTRLGGRVVLRERYDEHADFAWLAGQLNSVEGADVLVAGEPEALRQVRRRLPGRTFLFAGEHGLASLQSWPETRTGVLLTTAYVHDVGAPAAEAFRKHFRAAYQDEPSPDAALAYESATLLFRALRAVDGPATPSAVRQRLESLGSVPGLFGPVFFGPDQRLSRPIFVVRLDAGVATTVSRYEPPAGKAPARPEQ